MYLKSSGLITWAKFYLFDQLETDGCSSIPSTCAYGIHFVAIRSGSSVRVAEPKIFTAVQS